ncbi:MAG: Snf7 family protein [Candidatus Njordarchaeia archaeon]
MWRSKKSKKGRDKGETDVDRYIVQANYYLTILEKRIRVFRRKLEKLERIKRVAAKKGQKEILIEALRSEKLLKTKLKNYLGMHQSLQQVMGKIADVEVVKGITDLFKEGGVILKELSREISPEAAEAAKIEVEDALADISETESVLGEPIQADDFDEEDLESEADKLIAEASLPKVGEKEEEINVEDLEKELKDIMLEEKEDEE